MSEVRTQSEYTLQDDYDNENYITIMPKDPHCLFAYWQISENRKTEFHNELGTDTWSNSYPALRIINVSENTSFFVRIDDSANSFYIPVDNSDSLYNVELGRRLSDRFFINLASSNYAVTPCGSESSDSTTRFVDCRDMSDRYINIYNCDASLHERLGSGAGFVLGHGSQQLFGPSSIELQQKSSMDIYGIPHPQQPGSSSESFLNNRGSSY